MATKNIFFSIIIATRNRPKLFTRALDSIINQTFLDIEIIVVNDGSNHISNQDYQTILTPFNLVKIYYLEEKENGHGPSYTNNYGVSKACGKYLCFLDDDDYWTDNQYLHTAYQHILHSHSSIDIIYSNQNAFFSNGKQQQQNTWIEDLIPLVKTQAKSSLQMYEVNPTLLLKSTGFAHINCSLFKASFYKILGGMDENIRYESDRDIYIRSLDKAKKILYNPCFIAHHNIPDQNQTTNLTTQTSFLEKKLFQLRVYDKGVLFCHNKALIKFCKRHKAYTLKHMAEHCFFATQYQTALFYSLQALAILPTWKWMLFTFYIVIKQSLPIFIKNTKHKSKP